MTRSAADIELRPVAIEGSRGRLSAILRRPVAAPCGNVLYLPPFAEELNMSRRMAALGAAALARAGHAVLTLDPFGTGDSAGDFADADWGVWGEDAQAAAAWLRAEAGGPMTLWGLRLGATLAVDLLVRRMIHAERALLWQPVTAGRQFLTQFLRIRVAAGLDGAGGGAGEKETTKGLRARLAAGETVEVAGYALSPALADAIEALDLSELAPPGPAVLDWLEVTAEPGAGHAPAAERVIAAWREAGVSFRTETVPGEAFWTIQETTLVPALIAASEAALSDRAIAA